MNIFLSTLARTSFNDPDILRLPRYKRMSAMHFALAVTHADIESEPRIWESDPTAALWSYLDQPGNCIVGFNVIEFDLPLIQGATGQSIELWNFTTFDIFNIIREKTGRWYRQQYLSIINLGHGRGGEDPTGAVRAGLAGDEAQWQHAIEYCRAGVNLNRQLLDILQRGKPLLLPALPDREEYEALYFYMDPEPRFVIADPTQPAIY